MAWIESHQELRYHYKTKRLARELKVTVAAAIGHLHCLWWWAIDFAPDGDLSKFDDYEIADAIGYEGKDVSKARAALISAGFLDNSSDGTLTIHDWYDYSGQLGDKRIENRKKERDRKAEYRAKRKAGTGQNEFVPRDNTDLSHGTNGTVPRDKRDCPTGQSQGQTGQTRDCPAPTVQYSTVQYTTVQDTTSDIPPLPPASGGQDGDGPAGTQEERFEEFWKIYPKKQGKGAAVKAWKRIRPDSTLFDAIMASVRENISRNQQWQRNGGQFIPNPATWLNQTRWLDEIPESGGEQDAAGTGTYHDFRPSTGFRDADSGADIDG